MLPILLSLIAFVAWGTGDFFSIVASTRDSPVRVTRVQLVLRIFIYSLFIPWNFATLMYSQPAITLLALVLGTSSGIGMYLFNHAVRYAHPTVVGSIAGCWGGLAIVLSLLFLHEPINPMQGIMIGVLFFGFILTTVDWKSFSNISLKNKKGIALASGAMVLWAITGAFLKIPVSVMGWYWPSFFISLPVGLVLLFTSRHNKPYKLVMVVQTKLLVIGSAVLTVIAEASFNYGLNVGTVPVVAAIGGSSAIVMILLSLLYFRESLQPVQKIGSVLVMIGIVGLSFATI